MAELFWRGCKILQQDVRILPSHFTVTCYPYKEVHVTAKSILHPRQNTAVRIAVRVLVSFPSVLIRQVTFWPSP